ncbi:unnamed protein product [Hymenolepis diminuta]|uniref:Uncharacterized protein n=1 Tax=Hymenolepis diminuta TaxID=6216 RepID=A0A564Z9F4_HYMDI|nr:unnamed protein product [Hymenolepis diminuta]
MAPNETYVNEFLEIASFVTHSSNILCRYDDHSDNFVSFQLLPDETCSFTIFIPADYPYQSPQWQYFANGIPVCEAKNDELQFVTTVKRAFLRITFLWSKILGVTYPNKAANLDPTFIEQMKIVHATFPEKFL